MAKKKADMDLEQEELAGVEGPGVSAVQIPEINKAAGAYERARDVRVEATAEEVKTKTRLIELLHEHEKEIGRAPDGGIRYRYKGKLVQLLPTDEKLTVKNIPKDDDDL